MFGEVALRTIGLLRARNGRDTRLLGADSSASQLGDHALSTHTDYALLGLRS